MTAESGRVVRAAAGGRGAGRRFGLFALTMLLAALATGARGGTPLTTADLVRFLEAGISERTILAEMADLGFAEPLGAAREAALRQAGASETMIVAVRRAAPPEGVAPASNAGAESPAAEGGDPRLVFPSASGRRGPVFGASTRTVRVPVSVLDKGGHPVLGLQGEDFKVSEDGRRQDVTFFSGERHPLRIALALDMSASMENKTEQVADALRRFIDLLEPEDEILVITFSYDVDVVQDFTSDRQRLSRVLSSLHPVGATALYDAAAEAIQRVAAGPAESKAVVLVTDGVDTVSSTSFGELRELARRHEVPVFSIAIGDEVGLRRMIDSIGRPDPRRPPGGGWPGGRGPGRRPGGRGWPGGWPGGGGGGFPGQPGGARGRSVPEFDAGPLVQLADETGGRAEVLKGLDRDTGRVDRLKEAVESIAITLRHRYLVGYEPPGGKRGWRKIRVEVDRPSVDARARKGYYAEG
ncbi:MAG TPA: VWA domain-containing protein [Vicinamibacteria bacterium]|nr:VWA domain-containing protein [Vicinamibacteria bacterium]